jgi:two-component system, NarL family, invasion response regulator UvrY
MNILIVDDHAVVRKGLKQIIAEEYKDANIAEAADTESLIAEVIKSDWDIIICDINMPGRSGLEGLRQIKEINPEIPVLIMSMNSEDQYALRVLKAGAAGYLNKDTVHEDIIPAIAAVRMGRNFITPSIAEKLADSLQSDKEKAPHQYLSNREFDVMKMLAGGNTITEIAAKLFLNSTTVSTYRTRIFEKTGMKTNADLTRYAIEHKII